MNLPVLSFTDAAEALQQQKLSSVELCRKIIDRCLEVDSKLNAFLHFNPEKILEAAAEADARRSAGRPLSRFDGLPLALKDNFAVRGELCTCASKMLENFTSPYDATVVARLREAGIIFAGRTNMDEFAMGSTNENSGVVPVSNPWNPECVPGGSSGGSAAAVAAGQALAALGSDTGGSIRLPAGFCGVVGLKPTYGRVSRYGLVAFASSLDQIGPLTRDVRDSATLLDLISGHDRKDSTSLPHPPTDFAAELDEGNFKGLRIGLAKEYMEGEGLDPQVKNTVEQAAETMRREGAEIVELSLPFNEYAVAAYYIIAPAEASANLARFDGIRYGFRDPQGEREGLMQLYRKTRAHGFGPEVKRRIILGTYVLSSGYHEAYYLHAQKARTLIRRDFANAFSQCDVILAPCSPTPAPAKGKLANPLEMYLTDAYTLPANLAGICGISIPAAFSKNGLPIAVQMLGPSLGEKQLLQAARLFEQTNNLETKTPDLQPTSAIEGQQ